MSPGAVIPAQSTSLRLIAVVCLVFGCGGRQPAPEPLRVYETHAVSGVLRAGAARVDVTPQEPVYLGGYGIHRRSRGVHDPIDARALWIERGELALALVAVDVVGLQANDVARLRARVTDFDGRHLVVASTHNHSGPDTLGLWGVPPFVSGRDADYMKLLEEGILEAVARARAAAVPAELAAGAVAIDPKGIMKNLRHPGLVDRELVVLHLRSRADGSTLATLTELGCHPEVLGPDNHQITADFPHSLRETVEAAQGGIAIHVSGALGGLVTPDVVRADFAEAERVGRSVGTHALELVSTFENYDAAPELRLLHAPFYLENQNWRYDVLRGTGLLERTFYDGGLLQTEINLWQLGALRIATVPGEITPDLGIEIKAVVGGRPTLLIGLANDELGYLLPADEFDLPLFDYERTLSPSRESGDRILREFEALGEQRTH